MLGAYLAWTLMAAEVLFVSAEDRDMPAFLARASGKNVPVPALVMTSALVQVTLATFYTVFLVFAAGLDFALLSFIIYAPGTVLFVMTRREQGRRIFSLAELIILVVVVAGAVARVTCLATGVITI